MFLKGTNKPLNYEIYKLGNLENGVKRKRESRVECVVGAVPDMDEESRPIATEDKF